MDYFTVYEDLIEHRKGNIPDGYVEIHHIIPKCLGGGDESENLVKLSAREHFIAHLLLAKMFPFTGLVHAAFKMACINQASGIVKIHSKLYEYLRTVHAKRVSTDKVAARKKSLSAKGKKQSPEHVKARTEARKKNAEITGWHSEEAKLNIGKGNVGNTRNKGKKPSSEAIEKRKETMRRNNSWEWTEERRAIQMEGFKRAKERKILNPCLHPNVKPLTEKRKQELREHATRQVTCPHCGKQGAMMVMPRWHFDNCKFKNNDVQTLDLVL